MDRIEAEVAAHRASAVHRVTLRIGEVSGVEPELLASAFEILKAQSVCAAATLVIERVSARWSCPSCGVPIASGAVLRCPACDRPATLAAGDEIVLAQLEMEVA